MDKRVEKRYKRQVARAKNAKTAEPVVKTRERAAATPATSSNAGGGRIAKLAQAIRSKLSGSKGSAAKAGK